MSKSVPNQDIVYYMSLPYGIMLRPDGDGDFVANIQELPGCIAHGNEPQEALVNLQAVQQAWIEECLESGQPIPEPQLEEALPSGKWLQRVPRTLHRRLSDLAKTERVSLNQLVTSMLAEVLATRHAKACPPNHSIGHAGYEAWYGSAAPWDVGGHALGGGSLPTKLSKLHRINSQYESSKNQFEQADEDKYCRSR